MSDPTACVRLLGVTKKFGAVPALDGVSLDVARGSFTTLLGPSGCGKTTLLRLIAGFYEPDAGEIFLGEKKVNGLPPNQRNTPLVFQDYALFPHMTVFENVAYGLKLKKAGRDVIREKAAEMLTLFNLTGLEKRFPRQLSGGQQQRVAFARALIMGSDILLLDEPLSNLDAKLRVEVREELKNIQKRFGITMIYVTHDQEEALAMSDRIAVMNRGRVMQTGTPEEIYLNPTDRFVADFVGLANFLPATVRSADGSAVLADCGGTLVRVRADGAGLAPGDRVTLLTRPESVSVREGGAESPREENLLAGRIAGSSFLGRVVRYKIEAGGMTFLADDPDSSVRGAEGGKVTLRLQPEKIRLLREAAD